MRPPACAARLRQPLLLVAAGRDQVVFTAAVENFSLKLLAGRHLILAGARHEILQEQDHYRGLFWAAFDALVPERRYISGLFAPSFLAAALHAMLRGKLQG